MASSDHTRDPALGQPNFPTLINDYRAQREAWQAHDRRLARLREEVLSAADREAQDILAAARNDVRDVLLRARRELLALAAQVQSAPEAPQGVGRVNTTNESHNLVRINGDDLHPAGEIFASARRHVRGILEGARPDLDALAREAAAALRSGVRESKPPDPSETAPAAEARLRFQGLGTAEPSLVWPPLPCELRSPTAFVSAFVAAGLVIMTAMGWWLWRSTNGGDVPPKPTIELAAAPVLSQPEGRATTTTPIPPNPVERRAVPSVNINVRRLVWLRFTVDGRVTETRLFQPGETRHVTHAREVLIRAGDAGAVFVSVNGGEASPLGRDSQVVTRRFILDPAARTVVRSSSPSIDDRLTEPDRTDTFPGGTSGNYD